MLGIVIKSKSKSSVYQFINSLELFGIGYSWGGFESLAVYNDLVETGIRQFFKLRKTNISSYSYWTRGSQRFN